MTPRERNALKLRLNIYEIALTEFLLAKEARLGFTERVNGYVGLCGYFKDRMNIACYGNMERTLPELYQTKPKNINMYWFRYAELNPRIKCLQKAIEITERKLCKTV